jgi:hypothetical protein
MRTNGGRWRFFLPILFVCPMTAGMIPLNSTVYSPTSAGFYAGGTVLSITITGTVSLGGSVSTNPDGSLVTLAGSPYSYFNPSGADYDITPPNWDAAYIATDPCGNSWTNGWSNEGAKDPNLSHAGTVTLGSVAGLFTSGSTFSWSGSCNSPNWFEASTNTGGIYTGSFIVPAGGASLWLVVPDTYYLNNAGTFNVAVNAIANPEPSAIWLALTGLLLMVAFATIVHRRNGTIHRSSH